MADEERGMTGTERGMTGTERGMAGGGKEMASRERGWQEGGKVGGGMASRLFFLSPTYPLAFGNAFLFLSFSHLPLSPVSFPLEPSLSPTTIEPVSHHLVCPEGTKQLVLVKTVFFYVCDVYVSSLPYIY